jgi:hypothetical protein
MQGLHLLTQHDRKPVGGEGNAQGQRLVVRPEVPAAVALFRANYAEMQKAALLL